MDDYLLRTCEPADEPVLLELFSLVFGQVRSPAEWRWKFGSNPGSCADPNRSDSVVAVDGRGSVVAHAGAVVLPGWFRDQAIPMVQVCDVMVHPDHRGGIGRNNLFTLMLRDLLERLASRLPAGFRYGFPGRGPYLVGERARVYEQLGIAVECEIPPARPRYSPWRALPLAWDDPRLDHLWERMRGQYGLSLIRNGAYLRWRYADNPSHTYRLIGVFLFGWLIGWVVSRQDAERLLLVDVLLPRLATRGALQRVATLLLVESPHDAARVWLPDSWRPALKSRCRETPVVTANMSWRSPVDTATARRSLYYTMGDVDIF